MLFGSAQNFVELRETIRAFSQTPTGFVLFLLCFNPTLSMFDSM